MKKEDKLIIRALRDDLFFNQMFFGAGIIGLLLAHNNQTFLATITIPFIIMIMFISFYTTKKFKRMVML